MRSAFLQFFISVFIIDADKKNSGQTEEQFRKDILTFINHFNIARVPLIYYKVKGLMLSFLVDIFVCEY